MDTLVFFSVIKFAAVESLTFIRKKDDQICLFFYHSEMTGKIEELTKKQTELKAKEETISKQKSEMDERVIELKQVQNKLLMKEEQLLQTQQGMVKVGLDLFINTLQHTTNLERTTLKSSGQKQNGIS